MRHKIPPTKHLAGCSPHSFGSAKTLRELVRLFQVQHKGQADKELNLFGAATAAEAIRKAALSEFPDGSMHDHQKRLGRAKCATACERLLDNAKRLKRCKTFHELYELTRAILLGLPGVGALYWYDFSTRFGAHLGLEPEFVYLHTGTKDGAEALGLEARGEYLRVGQLPLELQRIRPRDIEDFLCICKMELRRFRAGEDTRLGEVKE